MPYLLDTNISLAYARHSKLYDFLEKNYQLWTIAPTPIVSIVSVAELRTLAREFAWGPGKISLMEATLGRFAVVPIPFANIVDAYVEIADFSRRSGRPMGKNDLWIAATAMTTGATLLTTDRDFDHLDQLLITRQWVDPAL